MTKEEIFQKIDDWQMDAGESFVDYFDSSLRIASLMFWCRGKGYLTIEQFNLWEQALTDKDFGAECGTSIIEGMNDIPYSIVENEGEWEKGLMILAEFFSESTTYQKRLKKFFEEHPN